MEQMSQNLKELYEKDFYLWVQENLKLLKEKRYDLVDWENLLEEIRCMGEWYVERTVEEQGTKGYKASVEAVNSQIKLFNGVSRWRNITTLLAYLNNFSSEVLL